ncbi:hypothetical protein ACLOJK_024021 [Asimina triloba]
MVVRQAVIDEAGETDESTLSMNTRWVQWGWQRGRQLTAASGRHGRQQGQELVDGAMGGLDHPIQGPAGGDDEADGFGGIDGRMG